jgi:hypothetical protein
VARSGGQCAVYLGGQKVCAPSAPKAVRGIKAGVSLDPPPWLLGFPSSKRRAVEQRPAQSSGWGGSQLCSRIAQESLESRSDSKPAPGRCLVIGGLPKRLEGSGRLFIQLKDVCCCGFSQADMTVLTSSKVWRLSLRDWRRYEATASAPNHYNAFVSATHGLVDIS